MDAKDSAKASSASEGKERNEDDRNDRINRVAESKIGEKDADNSPSHFSNVQITNLISVGERNLQLFLDCCAENMKMSPWQFYMRRSDLFDIELYYVKVPNSKYNRWQSTCVLPYRIEEVVPLVVNGAQRVTWDHTMVNFESYPIEGTTEISLQRYGSKAVGPISGRDSCVVSVTRSYDDGARVACTGTSVPSSQEYTGGLLPEVPGIIRMEIMRSGYLFERCGENGKETKVTYSIHMDMKGWFLPVIQEKIMHHSFMGMFESLRSKLEGDDRKVVAKQEFKEYENDIKDVAAAQGLYQEADTNAARK